MLAPWTVLAKKFALFTGRDQMQALTGMFARQFGTPNYAEQPLNASGYRSIIRGRGRLH